MAEEELELESEQEINNNRVEKRIRDLSEKVKLTSKERDDLAQAKTDAEAQVANANKERDFFKDFGSNIAKYPAAAEYQDAIKEKVMGGYSVDDAMVSILAREGKLNNYTPPAPRMESPAGGSATNQISNKADKPLNEMTREEKRAQLQQIEDEGGVTAILRKTM